MVGRRRVSWLQGPGKQPCTFPSRVTNLTGLAGHSLCFVLLQASHILIPNLHRVDNAVIRWV